MKIAKGTVRLQNGRLIDGTGAEPVSDAVVVVTDGYISFAGPAESAPATPEARVLDARGGTIMPGLIEAHIHLTYFNVSELQDLDIKYPIEYMTLQSAVNAKTALEKRLHQCSQWRLSAQY
jgi:imidazolonepropionase-like amidohydrolase